MDRTDRRGLALMAAGFGLGAANVLMASLGRPLATWRVGLAAALLLAGLVVLAVGMRRAR